MPIENYLAVALQKLLKPNCDSNFVKCMYLHIILRYAFTYALIKPISIEVGTL